MKTRHFFFLTLMLSIATAHAQPKVSEIAYAYKNLTVFLLQGGDQVKRSYITLEEAMKNKEITLHETSNVGELRIDNNSDKYVFIMSGDIVKGGKQDRTISEDMVLKPKSKNIPLTSFCVEHGRWQTRGSEKSSEFSSSSKTLSNKNLKIAARSSKSQSEVWKEVDNYQNEAGKNVNANIKSNASASSLQLSLESKELQTTAADYIKALTTAFQNEKNVVGFAFCINGKISTIEYFGNAGLAAKLQKKLIESAVNEAIFEYSKELKFTPCASDDVNRFMQEAANGKETVSNIGDDVVLRQKKTGKSMMFRIFNTSASEYPIHVSIYSTEGMTEKITPVNLRRNR